MHSDHLALHGVFWLESSTTGISFYLSDVLTHHVEVSTSTLKVCNHLQMHFCVVYDHFTQHQTDFTCSGFADSMVAACLHQPLHSGRFITLGTASKQPSGRERSLGALPSLCFFPQESSADRGRCWRWNRVGKFVLLTTKNKNHKQIEKKN